MNCYLLHHIARWNSIFSPRKSMMSLTLSHPGGGSHEPPLGVISHHSVGDAPTNPKFLDFYQFDPYFHLVKSFFIFLYLQWDSKFKVMNSNVTHNDRTCAVIAVTIFQICSQLSILAKNIWILMAFNGSKSKAMRIFTSSTPILWSSCEKQKRYLVCHVVRERPWCLKGPWSACWSRVDKEVYVYFFITKSGLQ